MQNTIEKQTGAENIRWDLSDLFSAIDDAQIQKTLSWTIAEAKNFVKTYKGRITTLTSAELLAAFQKMEALLSGLYRLSQYSTLLYAVDTTNDRIKAFEMKVREESTQIGNLLLFFDLELGLLSEDRVQQYLASPELKRYAYYIKRRLETAKYNLSEKEEKIANLKNLTGSNAFKNLYEEFTTAFRFEFEIDGEKKQMTGEELRSLRQHEKAEIRQKAMKMFLEAYQKNSLVLTNIFNNVIKDYNIERKLRGYSSPISMQNVHNDLSNEAVNALHDVTTDSYFLVQRYYRLKARLLKMPDMTLADIYAPLPQAARHYTFAEARQLVLDAFREFDEDFYQKALSMFVERRIDAPVSPTKRGGAFCSSSIPELKPYVLLNFLGRLRDVSTMAHELGHAVHAMYSCEQSLINFHSILPLAETASVFSEMLLTEYLLKRETDPLIKQSLLTSKLEEIFATSHRQNMFSCFEKIVHDRITERLMSADELCAVYRQELSLMFGDAVRIPEEYVWEWASIPHMVEMPFYVYAYNFANLLVMSFYQQYKEQGNSFVPKLKQLLAMGSSASPTEITAIVGADITQPGFWKKSFVFIEEMIRKLQDLIEEQGK